MHEPHIDALSDRHHLRIRVVPPCCCLLSVSAVERSPVCLWITTAALQPPLPPSWPPYKCCCPSITLPPTCSASPPHPGEKQCAHRLWCGLITFIIWFRVTIKKRDGWVLMKERNEDLFSVTGTLKKDDFYGRYPTFLRPITAKVISINSCSFLPLSLTKCLNRWVL